MINVFSWVRAHKIVFSVALVLLALGGYFFFNTPPQINKTDTVKKMDLVRTVLATAQVESDTTAALSFKGTGPVTSIRVEVGDNVRKGDTLATIDQDDERASVSSAEAALAGAKAKLAKVREGATTEEVTLAERALESARVALENARLDGQVKQASALRTLLSSDLRALPQTQNATGTNPTISGVYASTEQGEYVVTAHKVGSSGYFSISGMEQGSKDISTSTPTPLGTRGLFIQFPSDYFTANNVNTSWVITIPNKQGVSYVTNVNTLNATKESTEAAVRTGEATVNERIAQLEAKKAAARPADVALAEADILSAEAALLRARAALENRIIRAPRSGVITRVDAKLGELAQPAKSVFVIQDLGNMYLKANVNETNVGELAVGQEVSLTFDALGGERTFKGVLSEIDPAGTIVSGVVNYQITASFDPISEVRSGMTANMTITTGTKSGVLAIPRRAIIERDGTFFVRKVTDTMSGEYGEVEIVKGFEGDAGLTEVVSGLSEGDTIVIQIATP